MSGVLAVKDAAFGPLKEILEERTKQDAKWGQQDHDDFKWNAILGEEAGEVAKAVLESKIGFIGGASYEKMTGTYDEDDNYSPTTEEDMLREEIVQTAAVCVAWLEAWDRRYD